MEIQVLSLNPKVIEFIMSTNTAFVEVNNLQFKYKDNPIFAGINIQVPLGKIIAIMGPSGTGKTTLLRLIGAQLRPTAGEILFRGENIHTFNHKKLFQTRKQMGLLFQSGALFTNLTVFENVAFPLREHTKLPEEMIRTLVLMKLEVVGLRGAKDVMPSELSGGMTRRVALARALVLDPALMMYDEPFTGLDPISKGVIVNLIKKINQTLGTTSILVSHDVSEVAMIADYIYVLAAGHIIGEGTPEQLNATPNLAVRQFMHGLADGAVPFHYPAKDYSQELME